MSVTYAIYNAKTRSIRNTITQAIGGVVNNKAGNITVNALKNLNLRIDQGDRLGLIGHNGAGKSTLLKVLCRVFEPTEGHAHIVGKVTSLTDITMGMDSESSGYDNIIMRCIFMGMSYKEAKNKIDEIIAFSELSEYINLPMRTYSAGMFLRLAFTIATSVTPEILIMDEMIGAGDTNFLEKAKRRTRDLIEKTKIIVISSHDLNLLKDICNRGIWLEKGEIKMLGPIDEVIDAYNSVQ